MNIDEMTPEQLRKLADELEAKTLKEARPQPIPIHKMDIQRLLKHTELILDQVSVIRDKDHAQDAYELLMMTIYGDNIFDWINKN